MKNKLLFFLLVILSYLVPKKKKLLIFGGGDARQFQGNPKYLLLYLKKRGEKEFEYYWSTKDAKQQEVLKRLHIPYVNPYTFQGFMKLLRAQYMFIEKSSYDTYYSRSILGQFNFIQTWHGTPLKKIGIDRKEDLNVKAIWYRLAKKIRLFSRQKYSIILASSEDIAALFSRTFENPRAIVSGYPRNDVLFDKTMAIQQYDNKLGLKAYNKVVLYAPTFRDHKNAVRPLSDDLYSYNKRLAVDNILLLVKKHPWQHTFKIPDALSNIRDISDEVDDIQELYPHVDVLVTDYSSAFFDFMLTNRPIIFYPYDLEEYLKQCRGLYYDYYEELQGPFAKTEAELFELIFTVDDWCKEPQYVDRYQKVLKKYNQFQDGNSSKRVLHYLYPEIKL